MKKTKNSTKKSEGYKELIVLLLNQPDTSHQIFKQEELKIDFPVKVPLVYDFREDEVVCQVELFLEEDMIKAKVPLKYAKGMDFITPAVKGEHKECGCDLQHFELSEIPLVSLTTSHTQRKEIEKRVYNEEDYKRLYFKKLDVDCDIK